MEAERNGSLDNISIDDVLVNSVGLTSDEIEKIIEILRKHDEKISEKNNEQIHDVTFIKKENNIPKEKKIIIEIPNESQNIESSPGVINNVVINNTEYNLAEYTEPEYYNDFLITLKEPLKNVTSIEYINASVQINNKNINNHNNSLTLNTEVQQYNFAIAPKCCNLGELIIILNQIMIDNELKIQFSVRQDKYIVIKSESIFNLENDKTSVLHMLGFIDKQYSDLSEYVSDNRCEFGGKNTPILKMTLNGDKENILKIDLPIEKSIIQKLNTPIEILERVIIKIKQCGNRYYDLENNPPAFNLKFT